MAAAASSWNSGCGLRTYVKINVGRAVNACCSDANDAAAGGQESRGRAHHDQWRGLAQRAGHAPAPTP